jgi:hypothetical protein
MPRKKKTDRSLAEPGDLLPGRWSVPAADELAEGARPLPLDAEAWRFARAVGWLPAQPGDVIECPVCGEQTVEGRYWHMADRHQILEDYFRPLRGRAGEGSASRQTR